MSPPDTDIEKQEKRHRWPLAGMVLVVAVAVLAALFWGWDEQTSTPNEVTPPTATDPVIAPADTDTVPAPTDTDTAPAPAD